MVPYPARRAEAAEKKIRNFLRAYLRKEINMKILAKKYGTMVDVPHQSGLTEHGFKRRCFAQTVRSLGVLLLITVMLLILSTNEAVAITNGSNDVANTGSDAVVQVLGCTGTLIAPQIVITAAHCLEQAGQGVPPPPGASVHPVGGFWEEPGRWYPLTTVPGGIQVSFGVDTNNPVFQATATQYNRAGYADIIMYALTDPVPAEVAIPTRVMTAIPGGEDPVPFFISKNFQMVGYGGGRRFRQIVGATYGAYPYPTRYAFGA
jgi:hypothetical protein